MSDSARLIDDLSGGFRASQVILTANRLGLFRILGEEKLALDEIVETLQTDYRGTRILCDALIGLALLEKDGDRYWNSTASLSHLVSEAEDPKIAQLYHAARLYERWGGLYDAVKQGGPVSDEKIDPRLVGGHREFAEAMADSARTSALLTAEKLDLSGRKKLLDIGGGPGIFAIEFGRRNPGLEVVILDNPETLEVAQKRIQEADLKERISTRPGDAFTDGLGSGYDFVFISNLIHIYSLRENRELVSRSAQALVEGGQLGIKDFFLEEGRRGDPWSLLFAVNMLVSSEGGDCYTYGEVEEWFEDAGLTYSGKLLITERSTVLLAEK